jgi:hypothetical protein
MPIDIKKILQRIDSLSAWGSAYLASDSPDRPFIAELETATNGILDALYGARRKRWDEYIGTHAPGDLADRLRLPVYLGILKSVRAEIEIGIVGDLRKEIEGEVFADFVSLAKTALEENKDVAAVLACAALEDGLKRLGLQNGLEVEEKDMSEVINGLKTKGVLKGAQPKILSSYVQLRNKAFHADWDKIDKASVSAAIGFTEQFLAANFS